MKQRTLFSILCCVLISSVSAQICMTDKIFKTNRTYDVYRRFILSSLPSSVTRKDDFFYNGSIGQEPNRVYAMGMCIPRSSSDDCSECLKKASDDLIQKCPNQTEAYTWHGDPTLCYVRYSNTSFSGSADLDSLFWRTNSADINTDLTDFRKIWERLMRRMIAAASTAKSPPSCSNNHYTAVVEALTALNNIYAMMQCTPDLSSGDCEYCLKQNAGVYQSCCGQKKGFVVMRPSCFMRWELYKYSKAFDNVTVASPPPESPSTVPRPASDLANKTNNDGDSLSLGSIVGIVVATVAIILLLLALVLANCRRKKSYREVDFQSGDDISITHSLQYDFETIEAATDKFSRSNRLGQGGFGEVYKGILPNGTEVAVKRLSKTSGQGTQEFKTEAILVAKLQHRNLVRLLGFCLQGEKKILVDEFVRNQSLNYLLFDPTKRGQLDWTTRYKIITGIARGIPYLHQDSRLTIIHRDLKASNVLLDADMNPKIADFGMARIIGIDQTLENTNRIVGTYGYMSPEYAMHGRYSTKSDVYSFGVLVLEIISGKRNSSFNQTDSNASNLVTHVWRLWKDRSPLVLVDPAVSKSCDSSEVTRCIHIALLCVQENPTNRPTLSTIILMLTSNTITLPVPHQSGFFFGSTMDQDVAAEDIESGQSTGKFIPFSINDATISDLEPR